MTCEAPPELVRLVEAPWSSVEATLAGLRAIDEWGRRRGDLRGVFAAAYVVVTAAVTEALRGGQFEDAAWVSQVVLDFAERYRVGIRGALIGEVGGRCWEPALRRSRGGSVAAIVALVHGMIAHIHFDLAHTLTVCAPLHERRVADYERLGRLIGQSTAEIQRRVVEAYAPELRGLHHMLGGTDTWVTNAVVRAWRTRARRIAERMHASPGHAAWWSRRLGRESAALALCVEALGRPAEWTSSLAGRGSRSARIVAAVLPLRFGTGRLW